MIISSIISSENKGVDQSEIGYYKDGKHDYDISISNENYEIKSFDFIKHATANEWRKLILKSDKMNSVIHMGETTILKEIKFVNAEEFLKEEK